jgi:hypothetical protein
LRVIQGLFYWKNEAMKKTDVIVKQYEGDDVFFSNDAEWFNATKVAAKYNKRPNDFLSLPKTAKYIAALDRLAVKRGVLNTGKSGIWISAKKGKIGGGTWMHKKLGVSFARWLDDDFAVWCDEQIEDILSGKYAEKFQSEQWKIERSEAAISYKYMSESLKDSREDVGKDTAAHHYMNEARLINHVTLGKFEGIDRNTLSKSDLAFLTKMERLNIKYLHRGIDYKDRKAMLMQDAERLREKYLPQQAEMPLMIEAPVMA